MLQPHESCQLDWRDSKGPEPGNKFRPGSFLDFYFKKSQNTKKNLAVEHEAGAESREKGDCSGALI
jgi:hypothetical protein